MKRICPNCNRKISEYESYFCTGCGHKLEDNLVRKTLSFSVKELTFEEAQLLSTDTSTNTRTSENKHKVIDLSATLENHAEPAVAIEKKIDFSEKHSIFRDNPKLIRAALFFLFSVGVLIIMFAIVNILVENYSPKPTETQLESQVEIVYANTIQDLDLDFVQGEFGEDSITLYVPYDVDYYLEGFDIYSFLGNYYRDSSKMISKIKEVSKNHFAIFGRKLELNWVNAIVFFLNEDAEFESIEFPQNVVVINSEEDYANLTIDVLPDETADEIAFVDGSLDSVEMLDTSPDKNKYYAFKIKDAVIVTDHAKFYEEIVMTSKKITRNISHQTKYASAQALLPKNGQLFFVTVSSSSEEVLNLYKIYKPADEFLPVLDKINNYKYDKFVIRNAEK